MRNISFALTTEQFLDGSKDVTRRMGWLFAKPGMVLCAVKKCQGLRPGEQIERIGYIEIVAVRRERLEAMTFNRVYGRKECRREGFPHMTPGEFVAFFCQSHKGCEPQTEITRIEFRKIDKP